MGRIVRCVVLDVNTLHVMLAKCGVSLCLTVGRIWSIVGEADTHVGNMYEGISRIEPESRQMCGELCRLGKGGE
jgi:hypothetical protein